MRSVLAVLLSNAVLVSIAGCGPTSSHAASTGPSEPANVRTLDENRALELIAEVLAEESVAPGAAWSSDIGHPEPLAVDLRLASSTYGIEWMSPQDRADFGEAIPEPDPGGQLRIVPGGGADDGAQILILDHSSYEFANEREHVQRGVPAARESEERLRRDVRDFLHYVRGQGAL